MTTLRVAVLLCVAAGCKLFEGDGDSKTHIDGDWKIERPAKTTVAPGELLEIDLENVDVEDMRSIRMWVDEGDHPIPPRFAYPDPDGVSGHVRVRLFAPFLRAGTHTLRFGADDVVRTGELALDVVVPAPRLTKAEVAQVMAAGTSRLAADVRTILSDPAADWQAVLGDAVGAGNLAATMDVLDGVDEIAQLIEADYMALPDEDEPAIQSMLDRSGVLGAYEELATQEVMTLRRLPAISPLLDKLPHLGARGLFLLDVASLSVSIINDAVAIFNVLTLLTPGTQPLAFAGLEAQLAIHLVRFVVDNIIPTDLYALDPIMTQKDVYHFGTHRWMYWGTFKPENAGSGVVTSLDNIVATIIGEVAGEPAGRIAMATKDVLTGIIAKLGLKIPAALVEFGPSPFPEIKVVVNMQAYSLTAGDLALLVPMFGVGLKVAATIFFDFQVISSIEVTSGSPPWAADTRLIFDYEKDLVGFRDTPFPDGEGLAGIVITGTGYRFTTEDYYLFSAPKLDLTAAISEHWMHRTSDVLDPNDHTQDKTFFITSVADYTDYVTSETPTTRATTLHFKDLLGGQGADPSAIDVLVNGVPAHTDLTLVGNEFDVAVVLNRGENTIQFVGKQGHTIGYQTVGGNRTIAFEVTFGDAVQLDKSRGVFLNPSMTHEIKVTVSPP